MRDALADLPYLPEDAPRRVLISDMVAGIADIADEFEQAVASLGWTGGPEELLDELAAGGALAYLRNADDGGAIGLLHAVTSPLACDLLLPWLAEEDRDAALGYVWQAVAALHVAYDVDRHSPVAERGPSTPTPWSTPRVGVRRRACHQADRGRPAQLRPQRGAHAALGGRGLQRAPRGLKRRAAASPDGCLASVGAMEYRTLGRTGIKVSPLCLGAMMFGAWGTQDHDESIRIIHAALDAGINFVDTADVYSFGESEEIVGKALAKTKRHKVVLATKVHGQMGEDPNAQGNSRRWIMAACDNSLRRLGTDYIDLYQIHRPSPETDIDETLGALTDLVRAGKIRYFGSSTFPAHEIVEAQWVAERRARERFVTEQPPYSILVRGIEKDVLPMCQKYGMGVLSWSPLAGGWLSGAFGPGKENTSRRSVMLPHHYDMELPGNRQKVEAVGELTKVADDAGLSLIQLALGFVLEHPAVTSPIIGPRTMEHLESQLPALDLRLGVDVLDRIDEIVPPGIDLNETDVGWVPAAIADKALRRRGR